MITYIYKCGTTHKVLLTENKNDLLSNSSVELVWIDVTGGDEETTLEILEEYNVSPILSHEFLTDYSLPRIASIDTEIFCTFNAVAGFEESIDYTPVQMTCYLRPNLLITRNYSQTRGISELEVSK